MDKVTELDLHERLTLIERLVQEGRPGTEAYGWIFVLWGLGHAIGLTWDWVAPPSNPSLPFAILMPLCGLIMVLIGWLRRTRRRVRTTVGRAVGLCWVAATPTFFLFSALEQHMHPEHSWADVAHNQVSFCLLIGIPNLASGLILRWPGQMFAGLLWWLGGVALAFASTGQQLAAIDYLLIVVCEIGLGLHLMRKEADTRREQGHA